MTSLTRAITGAALAAAMLPLAACNDYGGRPIGYAPPPPGAPYYADQYYREGPRYREHRLGRNDLVYRGRDGRYYCRRSDGTTGLIVGGIAGGVLGNLIAPGGSEALGTLLGAAGGALVGKSIDQNNVRCR